MLNQGVAHMLTSYPYLIRMLQKSQIKNLHFIEHPNTCTMILISRKIISLLLNLFL